ncbi:hypothetical protein L226DRAFT_372263 [Lentinus tigrinus ALCF2SS1-7]|uniref:Uncharacterized protein n=1 Tax=Lentinus tigrinus ALCF2SS1-6 TaxID=1328759 RepID=A0A5C2SRT8_9APHY|nr:hypothetical protein L227DRAFT_317512 [Lentinus tigrinus ALCF2SS1-6]RPD76286.1 hypothetical protein L226DRAFT_372263 [Lentinus tigrinus ALCF2SS1-7]
MVVLCPQWTSQGLFEAPFEVPSGNQVRGDLRLHSGPCDTALAVRACTRGLIKKGLLSLALPLIYCLTWVFRMIARKPEARWLL